MASADKLVKSPTRYEYASTVGALLEQIGKSATKYAELGLQTAEEDLQGIEPEARYYHGDAKYWERSLTDLELAGFDNRPEIIRLFEQFNIPLLNEASVAGMVDEDRNELADRLVASIDGNRFPAVLMASGCDYNGFNFTSEHQAQTFGRYLERTRSAIREQPFYQQLLKIVIDAGGIDDARRRVNRSTKGEFYVVFDTEMNKLRTHFETSKQATATVRH